jgi:hypothetical protein
MASVFMAALFALTASGGNHPPAGPASLDVRCYRLMATLAEEDDPTIRAAGITGAQYFLGRIDAAVPGFDPSSERDSGFTGAERERLIGQCGAMMGAGGRDFRALGQRLVGEGPTI